MREKIRFRDLNWLLKTIAVFNMFQIFWFIFAFVAAFISAMYFNMTAGLI